MSKTYHDFLEHYSSLTTDELIEIKMKGTLLDEAEKAIDEVISHRNINFNEEANQIDAENETIKATAKKLASIGARYFAKCIDAIPLGLLIGTTDQISGSIALTIFIVISYLLLMHYLPNKQSLGKRFFNIAVVDKKTGNNCRLYQAILRNLTLIFGIFDALFIISKKRERLGDIIAGTIVINTKTKYTIIEK